MVNYKKLNSVFNKLVKQIDSRNVYINFVPVDNDSYFIIDFLKPLDPNEDLPYEVCFYLEGKKFNKLIHNKQDDLLKTFVKQCCNAIS